jgi:hypothetical protein
VAEEEIGVTDRGAPPATRQLNWAGFSIWTVAAQYETDAASREAHDPMHLGRCAVCDYAESAARAEWREWELDVEARRAQCAAQGYRRQPDS